MVKVTRPLRWKWGDLKDSELEADSDVGSDVGSDVDSDGSSDSGVQLDDE